MKAPESGGVNISLIERSIHKWGPEIAKVLNGGKVVRFEGGFKKPWPFVPPEVRPKGKHIADFHDALRETLYSIWLAACFRPDLLSNNFITKLFPDPTEQIPKSSSSLVNDLRNKLVGLLAQMESRPDDPTVRNKFEKHWYNVWYSFASSPSLSFQGDTIVNEPLGSVMFLSNEKIGFKPLRELDSLIDAVYRDLRIVDAGHRYAAIKAEGDKNRYRSDLAHAMSYALTPLKVLIRENEKDRVPNVATVEAAGDSLNRLSFLTRINAPDRLKKANTLSPVPWKKCLKWATDRLIERLRARASCTFDEKPADASFSREKDDEVKHALRGLLLRGHELLELPSVLVGSRPGIDIHVSSFWEDEIAGNLMAELLCQALFHATIVWLSENQREGNYYSCVYRPQHGLLFVSNRALLDVRKVYHKTKDYDFFSRVQRKLAESDTTKAYHHKPIVRSQEDGLWFTLVMTI